MYHWIESIALTDGVLQHINYHQSRLEYTLKNFSGMVFSLEDVLKEVEGIYTKGIYKVRVLYGLSGVLDIEVAPYLQRTLNSFQLVEDNTLDYHFKSEQREHLNQLKQSSSADEVIITQHGSLTDTSFSNLIFYKNGEWFTPSTYLLKGTQRQYLLDKGIIKEDNISVDDLPSFSSFKLINAMITFESSKTYPIEIIHP